MGSFMRCWSRRHQAITVPSLLAVYRWWPSQEYVRLEEREGARGWSQRHFYPERVVNVLFTHRRHVSTMQGDSPLVGSS